MKQHPILFSTPMVQAILQGNKTQTRRIVKVEPESERIDTIISKYAFIEASELLKPESDRMVSYFDACPYGKVGEILWVRETFALTKGEFQPYDTLSYKADNFHRDIKREGEKYKKGELCEDGWFDEDLSKEVKWKPSIHMPKAACRIWLQITDIRVERVASISRLDALAEGIQERVELEDTIHEKNYYQYKFGGIRFDTAINAYEELWCKINGNDSWSLNPWVWVIEFNQIQKP